ncbi:MAG: hypothetical protein BMS9Abin39_0234 [Ignavibacteria bacterium]|nr:MAG: hypothetical protein BMS9Abin39_0234 [Ignavibacteria bacterium]
MDLIKQYIVQSLTAASNNLRLTTHQLETIGLLREALISSDDMESTINKMKKITELSTLAIRLNDIYRYLSTNRIDFFNLSDQFKSHSQHLITDLNCLLVIGNSASIKLAIDKLNGIEEAAEPKEIKVQLSVKANSNQLIRDNDSKGGGNGTTGVDNNDFFKNYEEVILTLIKPVDTMLSRLEKKEVSFDDLSRMAELMKMNGEYSDTNGFEIIGSMHRIMFSAMMMINSGELKPTKDVIESMRACLIVIVAVVRGKDYDVTNYLNKAEDFEKEINVLM